MIRLILTSFPLIVLTACATPPRDYVDPRPTPTVEQRAAFGTIGIAAAGVASPAKPNAPKAASNLDKAGLVAGSGAYGVAVGAAEGLACGPFAIVCVPTFALVGGAIGLGIGTGGALSLPTEEQINSADITLRNALLSVNIENSLVEIVLAQASEDSSEHLRRVAYSIEADTWNLRNADGEVDTRMLIAASKVELVTMTPDDEANPPVRLEVVVEGQIFEDDREAPTFERRWRYDSEVHDYLDWADDQGVLVITELNRAITVLGAQIVADFLAEGYQTTRSLLVQEKLQPNLAANDARPADPQHYSEQSAASPSRTMARSEKKGTKPRKLRVAIFPFASGFRSSAFAENEIANNVHEFVTQRPGMELIYSAYDTSFGHAAVGAGTLFWMGDYVSKTPNESNIYRTADELGADLVLTYSHQNQVAGWYSNDQYKFELYVFDVQQRRIYQGVGDQHSVREVLELIFWQIQTGRSTSYRGRPRQHLSAANLRG